MTKQLRLAAVDPPRQIRPSSDRTEPAFWIRRLRILKNLEPGEEHVIREVELRRGFNIVWAPPDPLGDENRLFQSGVAGHTAGKTMFCRLLRYVLGDASFATDGTRRRIREKLSAGWVVAEIMVEGRPWIVARPFGVGAHPFCLPHATIDNATDGTARHPFQSFLDELGAGTLRGLSAARFPADDESVRWEHLLPWIARDQECRFSDFLEWRHSSSDSDAPLLKAEERQFVTRSVLGLISDAERIEQRKNADLVKAKEDAARKAPLVSHQARVDHGRVSRILGTDFAPPSTDLFGSQARAELDQRANELDARERDLAASDGREALRTELEQAISAETHAIRSLQDTEARLAAERMVLEQLAGDNQTALLAALPPASDYCNVRITVARDHGCPLAASRPLDLSARRSERSAAEEVQHQRAHVESLEATVRDERQALATTETATRNARLAFMKATTAFDEQRRRLLDERSQFSQAARLVQDAEESWKEASSLTETVAVLDREINESYDRQKALRRTIRKSVARFSATFDYVVRALLGDEVSGRVDTSGRGLALQVDEHGERDSAAIATIRLLAFDLAALISSIEGYGAFPRFLIHDGPREADLAEDIYARVFLLAHELERCFAGEPSFQYVLTTTSPPPDEFVVDPWLRLRLAGAPAEERLLRCDL